MMSAQTVAVLCCALVLVTSASCAVVQHGNLFPEGIQIAGNSSQTTCSAADGQAQLVFDSESRRLRYCSGDEGNEQWMEVVPAAELEALRNTVEELNATVQYLSRHGGSSCNCFGANGTSSQDLQSLVFCSGKGHWNVSTQLCACFNDPVEGFYQGDACEACGLRMGRDSLGRCTIGLLGSPSSPGRSCKHMLELDSSLQDGQYYIQPVEDGPLHLVYCKMTPFSGSSGGGGWTLLSAQEETNLFNSEEEFLHYDAENPLPTSGKYSALGIADDLFHLGSGGIDLMYEDINGPYASPVERRFVHSSQEAPIHLTTETGVYVPKGMQVVEFNVAPTSTHFTGYGRSRSASCFLDGRVHSVWFCVAQRVAGSCGTYNGVYESGEQFCDGTRVVFWAREAAATSYGSYSNPGVTCRDILDVSNGTATDGKYYIQPNASHDPLVVYCKMTPFAGSESAGGGFTMLLSQHESNYFGDKQEAADYNVYNPEPTTPLYSIVDRVRALENAGNGRFELMYEDIDGSYWAPTERRWMHSTQNASILYDSVSGPYTADGFAVLGASHSPQIDKTNGYSVSRHPKCNIDGNAADWWWCVGQTEASSSCGLISSRMEVEAGFCNSDMVVFWIREIVDGDYDFYGSFANPGKSCKDVLSVDTGATDGQYFIRSDGGMISRVYCKMTPFSGASSFGGGWTLLSAQLEPNYFSDAAQAELHRSFIPSPDLPLYSILSRSDWIRDNGPSAMDLMYEDIEGDYWSPTARRWILSTQSQSIMDRSTSGRYIPTDFAVLDSSHPLDGLSMDGYGRSRTGSCYIDGNVKSWWQCVAQFTPYSNCGLVNGRYSDGHFCSGTRIAFWMREKAPSTLYGSEANPGNSCLDILSQRPDATDGKYYVSAGSGDPYIVYCRMTPFDGLEPAGGGFTLLSAQAEPNYFADKTDAAEHELINPTPEQGLYSILGRSPDFESLGTGAFELVYEDIVGGYDAPSDRRWVHVRQNASLHTSSSTGPYIPTGFEFLSASQDVVNFDGFGISRTGQCYIDGHVESWWWCVAQLASWSSCGMVSGNYVSGGHLCSSDRIAFWIREQPVAPSYPYGSFDNPGKTCLDILDTRVAASIPASEIPDGVYHVFGADGTTPMPVYCRMQPFDGYSQGGGGWTLLSAQLEPNYFSDKTAASLHEMVAPRPDKHLYSILSLSDVFRANGPHGMELMYEDIVGDYYAPSTRRWFVTKQEDSLLVSSESGPYVPIGTASEQRLVAYSHALTSLTGFGLSRTGSCYIDGHVHSWWQCVAQTASWSSCGLVSGRYTDINHLCNADRIAFWMREYSGAAAYGEETNPGQSCRDILTHRPSAPDGKYFISDGSGGVSRVYCQMASFDFYSAGGGGWTLLTVQEEPYYFSNAADAQNRQQSNPNPEVRLYSLIDKADLIHSRGNGMIDIMYEDIVGSYDAPSQRRWTHFEQSASINVVSTSGSYVAADFAVVNYSHAPDMSSARGFGRSRTSQCYIDGNVQSWWWCIAQFSNWSSCGMVSGRYTDTYLCSSSRIAVWIREQV